MILLIQVAVILTVSRALRRILLPLRQPAVVAEMVAGLLVGPSCLGWIMPRWSAALFPAASLDALNALSQIGLVIFMFVVGSRIGSHAVTLRRQAAVLSAVSIVVPFSLGMGLAAVLHERLAPHGVGMLPFTLFIGAAMSITAFPVLARILKDRDLLTADIGVIAIACAAFDDVAGWLILGGILSLAHVNAALAIMARTILFAGYLATMFLVVRPLLAWIVGRRRPADGSRDGLAAVLLVVFLSAAATDALGVHALFGAFLAGLVMPRGPNLDETFVGAVEPLTTVLLLPLFFAVTGLRTRVTLIDSPALVFDTLIVLAIAVIGKGGASALAARVIGIEWRDACALGVLLNTRGLIELVILTIGLEAGILSPVVFSMFVVMALVTTFMTSPILDVLLPRKAATTSGTLPIPAEMR